MKRTLGVYAIFAAIFVAMTNAALAAQTDPGVYPANDREAARLWFNANWPSTVPSYVSGNEIPTNLGFTGNVATGVAGDTAQAWKDQALLRLNLFRRMAALTPATFDVTLNQHAQVAALLLAANQAISHTPPKTWKFWSQEAYDACSISNLSQGDGGASAVLDYLIDFGSANISVGHRTRILCPATTAVFGIGDASKDDNVFNALTVPNPTGDSRYVVWPAPGYTPHRLIPGRWSYSLNYAMPTSSPTVTVTRDDGIPVKTTIISNGPYGVTWTLDGSSEGLGGGLSSQCGGEWEFTNYYNPPQDVHYHVHLTGLVDADGRPLNGTGILDYDVTGFNPDVPTAVASNASSPANISTRSWVGRDSDVQIAGFVITGTTPKSILVRASGPALGKLGVSGTLADPTLELHDQIAGTVVATNDNWCDDATQSAAITSTASRLGAFAWSSDTKDAAVLLTLKPGVYSGVVQGKNGGTGAVLIEVYDADATPSDSKLVNISTRSQAQTGDNVQIAGFVIMGNQPKTVLIRAGGPVLTALGVAGAMADPSIELHDQSSSQIIAVNDNWCDSSCLVTNGNPVLSPEKKFTNAQAPAVTAAASKVGAYGWTPGSKDSAILITLKPGVYSAVVNGVGGGTGVSLVEVYTVD